MKLLRNLLETLTKKDLRHFFVRLYNLFGVENPLQFSNILIKTQEHATIKDKTEERVPTKDPNPSVSRHRWKFVSSVVCNSQVHLRRDTF